MANRPDDNKPPERIHNWQRGHLSIARHFGGITYNGHHYTIAYNEAGSPLVRWDIFKAEAATAKKARRDAAKERRDIS